MGLEPGAKICVVTSDGGIVCVYARRIQHTKSDLMGGKVTLIQYAPTPDRLGPNQVEGTVFEADQGVTWDLGWEPETQKALAAASALTGESVHDFNDIDLTEAMEGLLRQPVH